MSLSISIHSFAAFNSKFTEGLETIKSLEMHPIARKFDNDDNDGSASPASSQAEKSGSAFQVKFSEQFHPIIRGLWGDDVF